VAGLYWLGARQRPAGRFGKNDPMNATLRRGTGRFDLRLWNKIARELFTQRLFHRAATHRMTVCDGKN
jgi:hypothetical protein